MTALLTSFFELVVRGTVLLVLAHAALWLLRRRSAATRELVGRWFVVALCALPLLTLSGLSLAVLPGLAPPTPAPAIVPDATPVAVLGLAAGAGSDSSRKRDDSSTVTIQFG